MPDAVKKAEHIAWGSAMVEKDRLEIEAAAKKKAQDEKDAF